MLWFCQEQGNEQIWMALKISLFDYLLTPISDMKISWMLVRSFIIFIETCFESNHALKYHPFFFLTFRGSNAIMNLLTELEGSHQIPWHCRTTCSEILWKLFGGCGPQLNVWPHAINSFPATRLSFPVYKKGSWTVFFGGMNAAFKYGRTSISTLFPDCSVSSWT